MHDRIAHDRTDTISDAAYIGWALQGYTPGRFPVTDVIEMPFTFSSAAQATEPPWEAIRWGCLLLGSTIRSNAG